MESKFTIYCSPRRLMRNAIMLRTIMFSAMMLGMFSFAQAQTVTGKVIDANGVPLLGVNVLLKNTNTGTVTDFDGQYQLSIGGQSNATLTFSYIGYETKEIVVAGKTVVNVTLNESASALDEVVVTALGIKKESKRLAYSVETVEVADLQANRTNNIGTSLVGKVAGLDISPPASGAGSSTKIRMRGQSAFDGANNAPLIVINGLPIDQGNRGADGPNGTRDRGDNMSNINPDDVESMTVLKGATAAALYGSRASNGAIIITTKSGNKNQGIGVELSSSFTANTVLDFTNYQTEYGLGTGGLRPTTQGQAAGNGQLSWGEKYDGVLTPSFDGIMRPYSALGVGRIKDYYRTGNAMTNSIALSGGGANGSYRASFAHTQADGIDPINTYTRKVVNLGLNQQVTEKLSFSLNINYTNEYNNNPPQVALQGQGAANFLHRISLTIPTSALRDNNYDPVTTTERVTSGFQQTLLNPYYANDRIFYRDTRNRLLGTATLRYEFTDWLYAQGRINYDYSTTFNERNNPTGIGTSNPINQANGAFSGSYNVDNGYGTDLNADFLLGTNNVFGDFSVDVSVGGNIFKTKDRNLRMGATDFLVRDVYSIGNGVTFTQFSDFGRSQVNSLYAFADFGYKGILFLNATGRNDWFSVLDPALNSYFYPSIGGSFIFSEVIDAGWLTYGKLRATYADVGAVAGVGSFSGLLSYNTAINSFDGQKLGSIGGNGTMPNPLLKPYSVSEKEIGLELRMFKSRVNLDVAVYEKTTTDQILPIQFSQTSGYTNSRQNLGSLRNRGVEFLFDVTPVQTDSFTWNSAFNAAFNESEVLKLYPTSDQHLVANFGGNEFLGRLYHQVGLPLNQVSARTYLRDDQGRIQVRANGTVIATNDYVYFGSALPKWTGGWTNTFTYKNLSLLVHTDFKAGGKVISSTALNGLRQGLTQASLVGRDGTAPIPDAVIQGTDTPAPAPTVPLQNYYAGFRNDQIGDPFIFKSDFIKLRTISLTYDMSGILRDQNSFIKRLTLSATCRNVAVLYKDIPDLDPEAFASTGDTRVGYEQTTLPTTRDFTFTVNVKF
ncbi:SusC/RagA family TonB-linked outer membrane protein [Confluentibacter sediminis]|uniref:SusC/RagA family TonB-linked outer membrane protein n=1 Tax=Confluentibacter sediminis TaxID=2219045 RepID=UPI000DAB95F2|nr:SusC/RagA family TonB-linked outer membrane protein [Confluentibacter sediminis]